MENKNHEYYLKNKQKWKTEYSKMTHCEICKTDVKRDHFNSMHLQTKKHIRLAAAKAEEQTKMELIRSAIRLELMAEMRQN